MNKWKIAFFISLVFCLVIGIRLIYNEIDYGYTITYQNEGYSKTESDFKVLREMISQKTFDREGILKIMHSTDAHYIKTIQMDIYLNRVEFLFNEKGILEKVKPIW